MNKLRIGLDLDGVVYNLMAAWLDVYNADYADTLTTEQITHFHFKDVPLRCHPKRFLNYLYDSRIHLAAEPIEGSIETIKWMMDRGHLPVFITSTKRSVIAEKTARLIADIGAIQPWEIHYVQDKSKVWVDMLVDDYHKNLWKYIENGVNDDCLIALFTRPWNMNTFSFNAYDGPYHNSGEAYFTDNPVRVHDWQQIKELVQYLEEF